MDRKDLIMDTEFLQKVLDHSMLLDGKGGVRADLSGAKLRNKDLRHTNLRDVNLRGADLTGADLTEANLTEANLTGANLTGANLAYADLTGANLTRADLTGANLTRADLTGANLTRANLTLADLTRANLTGAILTRANLRWAILTDVDLTRAINIPPIVCPETGSFIGYKKALSLVDEEQLIVTLEIPEDAKRSSATTRKCRCSKAKVIKIETCDGRDDSMNVAISSYDRSFIYRTGEMVGVSNFDDDRWNECAPGIHFFLTREEAVTFRL